MAAKVKAAPKAGAKKAAPAKKAAKPAGPGAIAAGGGLAAVGGATSESEHDDGRPKEVEAFAATGIDNALDLLEVVNAKMDKASIGSKAADIERHPEVRAGFACAPRCETETHVLLQRRFKAAFEAYKERELPNARADVRGFGIDRLCVLLRS